MFCRAWRGFDPEFQLLLACTQIPPDRALIRTLCGKVKNWGKVIEYAAWHELSSIVGHSLLSDADALPAMVVKHFAHNLHETARQNLFLCGELLRIVQALSAANIRTLPYKGPSLAISGHDDLALRNFCDLDILVPETDVPRSLQIMDSLGYQAEYCLTPAQEARYLRAACEYNFFRRDQGVLVEIHWNVAPQQFRLRFDFDRLWLRSRELWLGGRQLRMLSREDCLLALGVHGLKHLWEHLKWVRDIAILLSSSGELDWTYIVDEADRLGILRSSWLALSLAHQLFGSSLSASIQARISRDSASTLIRRAIVDNYASLASLSRLKATWLTLRTFSGFRNRASYVRRVLLDPSVEEAVWGAKGSRNRMRSRRVWQLARRASSECYNLQKA